MAPEHGIDLLHGEQADIVAKPHPLSFLRYHLFAVYLIMVAVSLGWFHIYIKSNEPLHELLSSLDVIFSIIGMDTVDIILLILFWMILLLSGFIIGVLWVTKMPLLYMVLVAAVGTALEVFLLAPYETIPVEKPMVKLLMLGVAAAIGMVLTEVYRRGHAYIITNYRIIMRKGLLRKEERELMYDKITDIYVSQGILGRLFNFGTIVPITASGFGLGEDSAHALIVADVSTKKGMIGGGFLGGTNVQRPRTATYFSLYGIPDPKKIRIIVGNRQLKV